MLQAAIYLESQINPLETQRFTWVSIAISKGRMHGGSVDNCIHWTEKEKGEEIQLGFLMMLNIDVLFGSNYPFEKLIYCRFDNRIRHRLQLLDRIVNPSNFQEAGRFFNVLMAQQFCVCAETWAWARKIPHETRFCLVFLEILHFFWMDDACDCTVPVRCWHVVQSLGDSWTFFDQLMAPRSAPKPIQKTDFGMFRSVKVIVIPLC